MSQSPRKLEQLEKWMLHVVSHPEGIEEGIASDEAHAIWVTKCVEDIANPGPQLSATDRLRVYSDMYYWRLIDALADDFPVVQFVLGQDQFYDLAKRYIHKHTSTSPNLCHLGAHFAAFIKKNQEEQSEFLGDLAQVERATSECFDEKEVAAIPSEELLDIAPDAWGELRLDLIPAHRRLTLQFPVDAFIEAHKEERHMDVPQPQPSWLLIYRRDYSVWRSVISEPQAVILDTLALGGTLLDAIEAAADLPEVDFEELIGNVGNWFQIWTGVGLFSNIHS